MNKDKLIGLVALLGVGLFGGAVSPSLVKIGLQDISPFLFNFLRAVISVLILLPVLYQQRAYFRQANVWLLGVLAGLGLGSNVLLFAMGITKTTIVASQLIFSFLPVIVPVLAYLLIKEKYNSYKALGTLISFLGIVVLLINSTSASQTASLGTLGGNGYIFLGMLSYATYIAISKKYAPAFSPWFLSALSSLFMALFFVPFTLYELYSHTLVLPLSLTHPSVLAAIGGAFSSVIFLWLLQVTISKLSSATVAMGGMISPQFGALAGVIIFQEKISLLLFVSMILVFSGVIFSILGEKQRSFWAKMKVRYSFLSVRNNF